RAERAQREGGDVDAPSFAVVVFAEGEEPAAMLAERPPRAGQVLFDEVERERIVARGHRSVRREDRRLADLGERLVEAPSAIDLLADPLQDDDPGVALVEVIHGRIRSERSKGAHAADAEHDLLLDAHLAVAAIEPGGELPVPRRVFLEVRVEQIELRAAETDA